MICNCATCGEPMIATEYAVITQLGLANNICSDECLKAYNCAVIDLSQDKPYKLISCVISDQEIKEITND